MSSKAQFGTEVLAQRKRVLYEGTSTIREGMPVAYNYDTTTNILGYDKGAGGHPESQTSPTTTAEGYQNEGKFLRVEDVTAANSFAFAGVVAPGSWVGKTGDGATWLELYIPNGAIVPVWTDKSVTIKDPLYLEPGQTTFTDLAIGKQVAVSMETADRSSTSGLVLAILERPLADTPASMVLRSRTAAQLPTAAIWQNFDLEALKNKAGASVLDVDFTKDEEPGDQYTDTTATIGLYPGTGGIGEMLLFTSADNEEAAAQWNVPITVSGGAKWAFETRVKVENITDARATCVAGLKFRSAALAGDVVADDGAALTDGDFVGFVRFAADGDIIDFIYDEGGQTTNVHDADYVTLEADTYVTLGMYFNGTTIQGYVNGTATGTAISAADIAAADFPTAAVVVPTLAVKGDNAADFDYTCDWIRVAQLDA